MRYGFLVALRALSSKAMSGGRRKFNPPLKKLNEDSNISQAANISCSSGASWSLPPTQTHTVLSYCEDSPIAPPRPILNDAIIKELPRKFLVGKHKRRYSYTHQSVVPSPKQKHKPVRERTNTVLVHSVYDYSLTPKNPTGTSERALRTKEQVIYVCYTYKLL